MEIKQNMEVKQDEQRKEIEEFAKSLDTDQLVSRLEEYSKKICSVTEEELKLLIDQLDLRSVPTDHGPMFTWDDLNLFLNNPVLKQREFYIERYAEEYDTYVIMLKECGNRCTILTEIPKDGVFLGLYVLEEHPYKKEGHTSLEKTSIG